LVNLGSKKQEGAVTANANNQISGLTYDADGHTLNDGVYNYTWNAESEMTYAHAVTYSYDGDGRRAAKVGSKLYWYGSGDEILAETDASGNILNEYVFFGNKRVAVLPAGANPLYYAEDFLGSSRVMVQSNGALCYDGDFTPYGGERAYTSTCSQNYKFEGKERDTETANDDFEAREYSWRFGRWLSSDWSATPVPVPYANLSNPQTLNLYAMVADDPESFADLDGHCDPLCPFVTAVSMEIGSFLARHPDVVDAFQAVRESMGIKASLGIGPTFKSDNAKASLAVSVTAELREDGSEKSKVQVTGGASLYGVGGQANYSATFAENGSLVNPLKNLDGNMKLTGSGAHGDNINSNAAVGTDGRVAAGPAIKSGLVNGGLQVTAGTQQVSEAIQAIGSGIINDVQNVVHNAQTAQTCNPGACSVVPVK
jgi:RHS repeat-associated protein